MKSNYHSVLLRQLPVLYEVHSLDSLPAHLVQFLARTISADGTAYNEVNLKGPGLLVEVDRPELKNPTFLRALDVHLKQHPLIRHQQRTGDFSARKISDFLSKAQYHQLALYREVYRSIGCEDQYSLTLRMSPDTVVAMAMNRGRRCFNENDREVLNLIQPHLIRVYRNAETLTLLQKELAAARGLIEALPLGLVILNQRFQIQSATKYARKLLRRYFARSSSSRQLPERLGQWLARTCRWRGRSLPGMTRSFSVEGSTGTLLIRCVKEAGRTETFLLFEERHRELSWKPLLPLGLTEREAEILLWVAQGKRNSEIAVIVGSALRTVQKHLERILTKLGVENRTAAAALAKDHLTTAV